MDKLKKVFSPGSSKDDDVMYENSQPSSGNPTTGPSASSTSAQPSSEDSSQWRDSTLAGLGVKGGSEGTTTADPTTSSFQRENRGDDVSDSTYTARSYQLPSGVAGEPQGPDRTVEQIESSNPAPPTESSYPRDSSLAGAGTITGTEVGASELAAQENKPGAEDVANATYTDRAYPVGGSSIGGHVPGEFPTETGEDPHTMPGAFPQTPAEEADRGIGSGSALASGAGVGGAAAGGTYLSYDHLRSNDQPSTTTESTSHPGGEGFPVTSSTESAPADDSHTGRNAAIAGGALAGTGAAGYGAYEATRGDDVKDQTTQDRSAPTTTVSPDTERSSGGPFNSHKHDPASGQSTITNTTTQPTRTEPATTSRTQPEEESNFGRDAAIAGGATAATGAAGYGAYEATRPEDVRDTSLPDRSAPTTTSGTTEQTTGGPFNSHKHDPTQQQSTADTITQPSTSETMQPTSTKPEDDSHLGRDTAIAGGATAATGAAGYGIYEATKDNDTPSQPTQERAAPTSYSEPTTGGPLNSHKHDPASTASGITQPTSAQPTRSEPTREEYSTMESARTEPEEESHTGRNAALAGAGLAGTGAAGYGAYEATKGDDVNQPPQDRDVPTTSATMTEGPFNSHKHDPASQQSTITSTAPPTQRESYEPTRAEPEESHTGRDAGYAGAGAAATGAAGYGVYDATRDPVKYQAAEPTSSTTTTQPSPYGSSQPTRAEPEESHTGRNAAYAGAGTAATGAAGYGLYDATRDPVKYKTSQTTDSTATTQPSPYASSQPTRAEPEESHTGRNAAYAGAGTAAAGAAGYGIYEASNRDQAREQVAQQPPQQEQSTMDKMKEKMKSDKPKEEKPKEEKHKYEKPKEEKPRKLEKKEKPKYVESVPARTEPEQQPEETHYGRDAAIVGGTGAAAGAAGYGVYQGTRDDPNDTGPASKTIGPHESNMANIMDPKVKPEPEKMKGKEPVTTGSYPQQTYPQQTYPQQTYEQDPNYSRDAALAGGAATTGAAGYGAYEYNQERPITPQPTTTELQRLSYDSPKDRSSYDSPQTRSSTESPSNKVSTDQSGHHHLHKKSAEQQGEKKPTLMQRLMHPNQTKKDKEERERQSMEGGPQSGHVGGEGFTAGEERYGGDRQPEMVGDRRMVREEDGTVALVKEGEPQSGYMGGDERYAGGEQSEMVGDRRVVREEDGMITLVKEGSGSDAPHAVVR
ncbi:uncharacterized protein LTR77_008214 [Saxophila tyrrhenica]|uniref:Uncharacterized protein n=1 Tax=Saxophila tyrrhenica TaxID=1690608 RepID=A0AAV9P257_9PEZI|nr:hypothetical protein LTR77_008214 [Saxophila tyrrhenica]